MSKWWRIYIVVLTVISITSLALNILIIREALQVQTQISEGAKVAAGVLKEATQQMGELENTTIDLAVPISDTLTISANIAISDTWVVPIYDVFVIDQSIPLEFGVPGRTYTIDIPLYLEVPIDMTVAVPVQRTIPVEAQVPINMTVPVQFSLANTPFAEMIKVWREQLINVQKTLEEGEFPTAAQEAAPQQP
nr:hypothetical protein [Ardenticatena sp.]